MPEENLLCALIRVLIGAGIFSGVSTLLKIPFPKSLLASATTVSFLIRTARYTDERSVVVTIPYSRRWRAYSGEKKLQTFAVWNTFSGIKLPYGISEAELRYR